MDDRALLRYSRHILLDEFGIEAQEKLLAARMLVVGAGGLGAVALTYGYQNFNDRVMYGTVLILVVIVALIQLGGNALYRWIK